MVGCTGEINKEKNKKSLFIIVGYLSLPENLLLPCLKYLFSGTANICI